MKRRLLAIMAMATLALGSFASPVAAHHIYLGSYHYYADCTIGADSGATVAHGMTWERSDTQVGSRIIAARGSITARALEPCTNGTDTYISKSFVWGADIQGTTSDGYWNFVQFGIGKTRNAAGYGNPTCGAPWNQDQTYFVWSIDASNTVGAVCTAAFVDFNGDGVMDTPVGGRAYTFSIVQTSNPTGSIHYWDFCVTDTYLGKTVCATKARYGNNSGIASAQAAWWGCEVGDDANAAGVPSGTGDVTIASSGYQKASSPGTWWYTTNSTVHSQWNTGGFGDYYTYAQSQFSGGETVSCRTLSHQ